MAAPTTLTAAISDRLRSHFPSLSGPEIFLENAGGSQVPKSVPDRMHEFMVNSYVQIGSKYPASARATETLYAAHALANTIMNGEGIGSTVIQPSTSQALKHLADAFSFVLQPGDEVVIAENGHEANIGPWVKLERFGIKTVWWPVDRGFQDCTLDGLRASLTEKTKLVLFPHTSNLLGLNIDVKEATRIAHEAGAKAIVDGVAAAPHVAPDVKAWGCDWYVFSNYKVFGPHAASIFGRHEAWAELSGPNHFFIPKEAMPSKQTLGCPSYEAMAGILGTGDHFTFAAGEPEGSPVTRATVESAYRLFRECEVPPLTRLLGYLKSKEGVRIVGQREISDRRMGIVSFLTPKAEPSEVTAASDAACIGIKSGHMYAYRLCEALGIDTRQGVIRISLAHYNTAEEINRLIEVLEPLI